MVNKEISEDILKLLKDRGRTIEKISISLPKECVEEMRTLAKKHSVPVSSMIECCIQVGLADPTINPIRKEENSQ